MEVTNRIRYTVENSINRIDEILNANNSNYSDNESIPSRQLLTYANGFYVNVTSLFIDIVGSSDMTNEHKRPTLAKMYRAFISESAAIMNSSALCKEININGDCVWGVFETQYTSGIDSVFDIAAQLNSLIKILNYKLKKKGYSEISVGIGIDYGRALMVKAGYSGSGLNDVIWMGDVVNTACHIANKAGRDGRASIMVSSCIYENLKDEYRKFFSVTNIGFDTYYQSRAVNISMNDWYEENCK